METILGLCIGVGLSAACGFRVFVPLLVIVFVVVTVRWVRANKRKNINPSL